MSSSPKPGDLPIQIHTRMGPFGSVTGDPFHRPEAADGHGALQLGEEHRAPGAAGSRESPEWEEKPCDISYDVCVVLF